MTPVVLSIADPRVAALILDLPSMQRWEVLRRSDTPLSPRELAAACRTTVEIVQHTLDRLVDAGFAVRVKASRAVRHITYRSVSKAVVLEYSHESERDRRCMHEYQEAFRDFSRRVIDRAQQSPSIRSKSLRWLTAGLAPTLNLEESTEVLALLASTTRALHAIEARASERARSERGSGGAPHSRGYFIHLQLQPLEEPELPLPQYEAWESRGFSKHLASVASAPQSVLSAKDREIARRLAAGDGRPKIAADLGLNPHTLASATKRIYARLGVRSRAELAVRMRGA